MYKETGKIAVNMSLIQVSEVDNSNQLEKKRFIKTLQIFKDYDRPSYSITQAYERKRARHKPSV